MVRVKDLIRLPKKDFSKVQQKKRRAPATAPEYHLTGEKSMKFIAEADERKKEKMANDSKFNKIKVEAVKEVKAKERKQIKKKQESLTQRSLSKLTLNCKRNK